MKIDPYKHKERYLNWKNSLKNQKNSQISKYNSDLILQYVEDMEHGINVANGSVKGSRSFIMLK